MFVKGLNDTQKKAKKAKVNKSSVYILYTQQNVCVHPNKWNNF